MSLSSGSNLDSLCLLTGNLLKVETKANRNQNFDFLFLPMEKIYSTVCYSVHISGKYLKLITLALE
jgi:hypothetical protein